MSYCGNYRITNDPVRDAEEHEDYVSPESIRCESCGEVIDLYAWNIEDSHYCDDCANTLFRRRIY